MKKRILSAILLISLIAAIFASCADDSGNPSETSGQSTEPGETAPERITPDIPVQNYDGFEYIILVRGDGCGYWTSLDFSPRELTGDTINDARYMRMLNVEVAYNVKISEFRCQGMENSQMASLIRTGYNADTDEFSAILGGLLDLGTIAKSGYLYNLYDLDYIGFDKPWWDQKSIKELSIQDRLFFITGDASTLVSDTTFAVLFSKQLMADLNYEDPYDLVREKKWTIDKMSELTKSVYENLNGTGVPNLDDRYGLILSDDALFAAVSGVHGSIARVDESGYIQDTFNDERIFNMLDKFFDMAYHVSAFHYQRLSSGAEAAKLNMFTQNRGLFNITYLYTLPQLRDMETDFGILPTPMLDETQEEYGSYVHAYGCSGFAVPSATKDPDRTSIILEALAYESYYHLKPAYYDISLNGRIIRDPESGEMLDIIFSTREYDVGNVYKIGGFKDALLNLIRTKSANVASTYSSYQRIIQTQINQVNESFAAFK